MVAVGKALIVTVALPTWFCEQLASRTLTNEYAKLPTVVVGAFTITELLLPVVDTV